MLAFRTKAIMKPNNAASLTLLKRQRKNILLRYAVNSQIRQTPEPELLVVAGISH